MKSVNECWGSHRTMSGRGKLHLDGTEQHCHPSSLRRHRTPTRCRRSTVDSAKMLLVVQMRAGARSIDMGEYEITDNGAAIGGQEPTPPTIYRCGLFEPELH